MSEEMNSAQEFFKTLEPLEKRLKQKKDVKAIFGTRGSKMITSAFILMKSQLGLLADDDENGKVLVPEEYRKTILDTCELIYVIAIENPLTGFYKDVVKDYLPLMNNWNKHIGRSKKMGNYILGTRRIIDSATTIAQANLVMRHLLRKLRKEMNYRPPAFDNSRHYLESLEEEIEALGVEPVKASKTKKKTTKKKTTKKKATKTTKKK